MGETTKIPIRVRRVGGKPAGPESGTDGRSATPRETETLDRGNGVRNAEARSDNTSVNGSPDLGGNDGPPAGPAKEEIATAPAAQEGGVDWQDRALRLQAEMENYRRRQKRLAQDQIETERERLLKALVEVVDDLERALATPSHDGDGLREGVQLTRRAALQRLKKEGVERIEARGQRFDPTWHEAVTTVPGRPLGAAAETVVQVLEPGYRLGDRLLRPARVVVAV